MKKGLKTTTGLLCLGLLSSVMILAASLGMGMRTMLKMNQYLQKSATESQFQLKAQLALAQIKNELQVAIDAQIEPSPTSTQPPAVSLVKATPVEKGQPQRYLLVRYWYYTTDGVGSLMRSVRDHSTSPQLQAKDLCGAEMSPAKTANLTQQVLLTDARPVSLDPDTRAQRTRQLTLRLLAATPAQILRRKATLS